MIYYQSVENEEGLWLVETVYDRRYIKKTESVFAQCNGHFGIRAVLDLKAVEKTAGMFVAGLYQSPGADAVAELVNCPDITELEWKTDGSLISFDTVKQESFSRKLNVYTGELVIQSRFVTEDERHFQFESRRFASRHNRSLFCQEIRITLLEGEDTEIGLAFGINGQITNSGVSHFDGITCRVYENQYMSYHGSLGEDGLGIMLGGKISGTAKPPSFRLRQRSIYAENEVCVTKKNPVTLLRVSYIEEDSAEQALTGAERMELLRGALRQGYDKLYKQHRDVTDGFWSRAGIRIQGAAAEEKAAIAFAEYHLYGMVPDYTNKYSVAAKGLTGEGYKGHVFWDTEIFVMPFFTYTFPKTARKLLEFRYLGKEGAKEKAEKLGYHGYMYPWEAARNGREETPLYAALNIHTGKANKVWSGIKEHHVTADIAYAVMQYWIMSGDDDFIRQYGAEMLFQTADFWVSRAAECDGRLEIRDIIGPDEYNEHIDNNAYTNYMAHYNVKAALELAENRPDIPYIAEMAGTQDFKKRIEKWKRFAEKIYLPQPGADGIIPQDDEFLTKEELPKLQKYKSAQVKQTVLLDYSRDEVVNMQVLKQADIVMLLNLFPHLFPPEIVKKNVLFYEGKTLHDSSLSCCAHAQACAAIGEMKMAWAFYREALEVDLCANPYDSADGIHAASLGGIWNCTVQGFAGVSCAGTGIRIEPHLPEHWTDMQFTMELHGIELRLDISQEKVILEKKDMQTDIAVWIMEKKYILKDRLSITYR